MMYRLHVVEKQTRRTKRRQRSAVACLSRRHSRGAQATSTLNVEGNKKLLSEAKINPDSAAAIAAAKMPGTSASTAKIEKEGKALVYSVGLLKPGSKGVDRVWVDANTGAVMKTKHYGGVSGRMRHSHQAHEEKEA